MKSTSLSHPLSSTAADARAESPVRGIVLERIEDRTIRDECMVLDGKLFHGCTLERCILEYSGGPVVFETTVFRKCRYVFFGPARGTVQFLQHVGLLEGERALWAEFPDDVN